MEKRRQARLMILAMVLATHVAAVWFLASSQRRSVKTKSGSIELLWIDRSPTSESRPKPETMPRQTAKAAPRRPNRSLKARSAAEDGGSSDLVVARGMGEAQGKKIASKPLRDQAGERSDRIVARDPPVKGPPGRVDHRQSAKESTRLRCLTRRCDVTAPARSAMYRRAPSRHPARTRTGRPRPGRRQRDKTHMDAPKRPKEHHADGETSSSDRQR